MRRYRKANDDIHAPEESKRRAARPGVHRRAGWIGAVAAVLAVVLAGGLFLWPGSPLTPAAHAAIVQAEYPELPPYPGGDGDWSESYQKKYEAWWDAVREQSAALRVLCPDGDGLEDFYAGTMAQYLSGGGTGNKVYSPLNIYMALAMLAEITDGDSRAQILSLLGVEDIAALRELSSALWNANYRADDSATSILASSLWLDEGLTYNGETLQRLADTYYASSYAGEMGSDKMNRAVQNWLNEQTGGLLKDAAESIRFDPDTVLALASTIYYKVRWHSEFREENNTSDVFHGAAGDVTATYMHKSGSNTYYYGEKFSAIQRGFTEGGSMWFILPDEGYTTDDLLRDPEAMAFLSSASARKSWEKNAYLIVDQSIPKFDVMAETDLTAGLKALGITDVFDPDRADFTPALQDAEGVAVSQAAHAARVTIDEEGCTAAAFTVIAAAGTAAPPEERVDFTLDRPFFFLIEGECGQPLFAGVVNQP